MRRLLILGMVLLGVLAVATPAQAAARMQIGEIWYNSPGSDRGGNASLNHEWVQLHNTSGSWITTRSSPSCSRRRTATLSRREVGRFLPT